MIEVFTELRTSGQAITRRRSLKGEYSNKLSGEAKSFECKSIDEDSKRACQYQSPELSVLACVVGVGGKCAPYFSGWLWTPSRQQAPNTRLAA